MPISREEICEFLQEVNPDALLLDGFEAAFVGCATQFTKLPLAVYDREKCLSILMRRDGMTRDEAEEFFSFNVEGAWVGDNTPLVLTGCDESLEVSDAT